MSVCLGQFCWLLDSVGWIFFRAREILSGICTERSTEYFSLKNGGGIKQLNIVVFNDWKKNLRWSIFRYQGMTVNKPSNI